MGPEEIIRVAAVHMIRLCDEEALDTEIDIDFLDTNTANKWLRMIIEGQVRLGVCWNGEKYYPCLI